MVETRRNETDGSKGLRRWRSLGAFVLLSGALLGGCGDAGFRPMYGATGIGGAGGFREAGSG